MCTEAKREGLFYFLKAGHQATKRSFTGPKEKLSGFDCYSLFAIVSKRRIAIKRCFKNHRYSFTCDLHTDRRYTIAAR